MTTTQLESATYTKSKHIKVLFFCKISQFVCSFFVESCSPERERERNVYLVLFTVEWNEEICRLVCLCGVWFKKWIMSTCMSCVHRNEPLWTIFNHNIIICGRCCAKNRNALLPHHFSTSAKGGGKICDYIS